MRSRQAATGSSESSRQTQTISSQSFASASSGGSSGWTRSAQRGFGHGPAVQFVVRSLTISGTSRAYGIRSRPMRAGSTPLKTVESVPVSDSRAARSSESQRSRWPIHGGTYSSVSSSASSSRARLISMSHQKTST